MLRYYTYYSIGGYKDLYLGSSSDKAESTYYLPLLSVLEEKTERDTDAKKEFETFMSLPPIYQLSDKNHYNLPSSASSLFSHAGYKMLYQHVEGSIYALAIRDIACGTKDELGRTIPFLFVITADTSEDVRKLDILATFIASYLYESEKQIASFIGYDKEKNGLRFKLREFNAWLDAIFSENKSCAIVTTEGVICINGEVGKVALLTLPSGIRISYAKEEQNIKSTNIIAIAMDKIISKAETERIISQLEQATEELKREKAANVLLKKILVAAGIGGFIFGAALFSCSGK